MRQVMTMRIEDLDGGLVLVNCGPLTQVAVGRENARDMLRVVEQARARSLWGQDCHFEDCPRQAVYEPLEGLKFCVEHAQNFAVTMRTKNTNNRRRSA
ncbi:hypothetical protein [Corynebacterium lizhenjunii]|uniref:hypothetical protein n=1 Tax=Corynebacterium lizhenjunii TaxID=2709394 RepID=UPI0013E9FC12|nr:hypothetical protein [Corynebacterium lizhenjunii]